MCTKPAFSSRVCGDCGGCGLCETWWLFIHLKIRKDFLCAAKLEPTNRQATRPLFFLLVLARAFIGGYGFDNPVTVFVLVFFCVCVCSISTLVSGNACSLQTYLLFYQILTYHQLVGNSHFFGSWLVFFGVGFLQVRKSLETVSKACLETCA